MSSSVLCLRMVNGLQECCSACIAAKLGAEVHFVQHEFHIMAIHEEVFLNLGS